MVQSDPGNRTETSDKAVLNTEVTTMPTRRQRKLEKKRRKEKKRKERQRSLAPTAASLAYHGNKYKTEQLVRSICSAETGILEAFVISDRKLTDRAVESALVRLIRDMRQGSLPALDEAPDAPDSKHGDQDLIVWRIRSNWRNLFEEEPHPGRDRLIGVLRTILGSIEVWKSASPTSRGYLNYVEGFLGKLGISVEAYSEDLEPIEEDQQDELLEIGRQWCHDGDEEAAAEFRNLAEYMIHDGQTEAVVEVCQRLMGEVGQSEMTAELGYFSIKAQQASRIGMQ